jgi:thymidylate synthase (FAD)
MKIIKPNVELIVNDGNSMEFIERIGRTCYKSTDKITEGSAKTFVQTLLKRQHYAMLEHDVIYVKIKTYSIYENCVRFINQFSKSSTGNSYINVGDYNKIGNSSYIISGNMRAFIELINERVRNYQAHHFISSSSDFLCFKIIKQYPDFFDEKAINLAKSDNVKNSNLDNLFEIMSRKDLIDKASDDTLFQHLTHTILFTCDRGVSHELVRHRPCSFAQESTRYCNYSMDKYDNNITVIEPFFFVDNPKLYDSWLQACLASEKAYLDLIENGASAQQARSVLPNSLKTEIIVTTTEKEWQHIINLRYHGTTGAPHPQMHEVMKMAYPILVSESNGRIK